MVYHVLMNWLLISIVNCLVTIPVVFAEPQVVKDKEMIDVYLSSLNEGKKDAQAFIQQQLKEKETFGYVKPYMPVLEQPIIKRVWIPDAPSEEDKQVLISGHWTYIMIQEAKWYTQQSGQVKEEDVQIPAPPSTNYQGK